MAGYTMFGSTESTVNNPRIPSPRSLVNHGDLWNYSSRTGDNPSSIILSVVLQDLGGTMADEENNTVPMAECGACRTVIPLDSSECPECNTKFSGISDEALGECGACQKLVPLDSTRCPECSVVFVADDVVDILRGWVHNTGINIRKLFEKFDENGDGTIDADELRKGLLGLNLADLPPSQVDRLVLEIDADGNGVIDLDEFDAILMGDEGHASESTDGQITANEPMDGEQDTSAEGHDTEEGE